MTKIPVCNNVAGSPYELLHAESVTVNAFTGVGLDQHSVSSAMPVLRFTFQTNCLRFKRRNKMMVRFLRNAF